MPKKEKPTIIVPKKKKGVVDLGGRPLKFKTPEILEEKINEYFESCFELQWKDRHKRNKKTGEKLYKKVDGKKEKIEEPYQCKVMIEIPTISGMAYKLNTSRNTLVQYSNKDEFINTIKQAKQFIESCQEKGLLDGSLNATGAIFSLKNNYGWVDKTEVDNTNKNLNMNITVGLPQE